MHHRYVSKQCQPTAIQSQTNGRSVFSAPRYCDSTENRGAYINIGPDYKLKYEQFDAVPHPDIKPMVRSLGHLARSRSLLTDPLPGICPELSYVVSDVSQGSAAGRTGERRILAGRSFGNPKSNGSGVWKTGVWRFGRLLRWKARGSGQPQNDIPGIRYTARTQTDQRGENKKEFQRTEEITRRSSGIPQSILPVVTDH